MGYRVRKFTDLTYGHERTFGIGHKFVEYGPAMRCLGYHPLFVLGRWPATSLLATPASPRAQARGCSLTICLRRSGKATPISAISSPRYGPTFAICRKRGCFAGLRSEQGTLAITLATIIAAATIALPAPPEPACHNRSIRCAGSPPPMNCSLRRSALRVMASK